MYRRMDGGEGKCAVQDDGDEEEDPPGPPLLTAEGPLAGVRLEDAPIMLLVLFHRAFREELLELSRIATEAAESGFRCGDVVLDLRRRFEFLKVVYEYHCTAEDEVIFQALDVRVKNVVCTYSLEHKSIDELFNSIFHCFNILVSEDEDIFKPYQELVFCIGTIQASICQHMMKEEKQVFPLLMKQFSSEEQASLVWQFMCSIPVMLLEKILQWITFSLSPDDQFDVECCMKEVVLKDKLLEEVVTSWFGNKKQSFFEANDNYAKGAQFLNGFASFQDILNVYPSNDESGEEQKSKNAKSIYTTGRGKLIDVVHLWHGAIRKALREILDELYRIRSSNTSSTLSSVVVQLIFFADILIFYSKTLGRICYALWNDQAKDCPLPSYEGFLDNSQIQSLQSLLYDKAQRATPLGNSVEKLCQELDLFLTRINKHLKFLETEVFPFFCMSCSDEMQQWLLYTCLHMMPLGLLKCTVTWFSAQLSEDESKSILQNIKEGGPLVDKSLASVLCEWVRIGYMGKTSTETIIKELGEMFNSRRCFLSENVMEYYGDSYLHSNMQPGNIMNYRLLETNSSNKAPSDVHNCSSSGSKSTNKYTSRINFYVSPQTWKMSSPQPRFHTQDCSVSSLSNLESRPMDHIFFFHKALKKDLEYLVYASRILDDNVGSVMDFHRRFNLVRFMYQMHSDTEDEIAFPALEAKGKFRNISHSYTIDHNLEFDHFNKVSLILDEISELHVSVSGDHVDMQGEEMLKYRQLCVKLHAMCISVQKLLCDHVEHEEIELWPLFEENFSIAEQEKIIGCMLGRIRAEVLQEMIPWLMTSLTLEEQNAITSLWRKATRNTMFDEWLGEWWEGMKRYNIPQAKEETYIPPSWTVDPLEVVSTYLIKEGFNGQGENLNSKGAGFSEDGFHDDKSKQSGILNVDKKEAIVKEEHNSHQFSEFTEIASDLDKKSCIGIAEDSYQADKSGKLVQVSQKFGHHEQLLTLSPQDLEAAIRRVSRDSALDPRKKAYIIQNLLMSRWMVTQKDSRLKVTASSNKEEFSGLSPSYRDTLNLTYGCKHYKRNCKLIAACCNKLYACRLCHNDDVVDHIMDRKDTTKMMCMNCLKIQPIGPTCSTASCNNLSMARYYCRICKLFDDEREIYHCPYCNLCRVGKGLGIDYFHCMICNACMSRSLTVHICREKCFEDNCPICHEYIFTSNSPVKALPCGHLMHSECFQDYTCIHYTCPICSKSLGDMQVYFEMLDAFLAEEKIPEEYSGKTQIILCNDCEKRGSASFHWLYHKCTHCGSYNTRLL